MSREGGAVVAAALVWQAVKEEAVLSTITKACGRLLHYVRGHGGEIFSSSRSIVMAEDRARRQAAWRERPNAAHSSASAKSDEAPA